MSDHMIILTELLLYFGGMLAIGIYFSKKKLTQAEYHLGGKRLAGWALALSERAAGESAWLILGLTGAAFAVGLPEIWVAVGCVSGIILSWTFLARKFREEADKYKVLTYLDYFAQKFQGHATFIRWFGSLILIVFYTLYVYAQFEGGGKVLNKTFDIDPTTGIAVAAVVTILYAMAGGFLSVVWADVVQSLLMIITLVVAPIIALVTVWQKGLSLSGVLTAASVQTPGMDSLTGTTVGLAAGLFVLSQFSWFFGYLGGQPQLSARWMAMKDDRQVKQGLWVAVVWTIIGYSGAILIGLCGLALYGRDVVDDPEKILPFMLLRLLPVWLTGLLLIGAVAAMMSTAASLMLIVTSVITEDIIHKSLKKNYSDRALVSISRLVLITVGAVSLMLALSMGKPIFSVVSWAWAGIGCTFSPAILLSFYWKKFSGAGVVASMVSGFTVTCVWMTTGWYKVFSAMATTFIVAFIMAVVFSLLFPKKDGH